MNSIHSIPFYIFYLKKKKKPSQALSLYVTLLISFSQYCSWPWTGSLFKECYNIHVLISIIWMNQVIIFVSSLLDPGCISRRVMLYLLMKCVFLKNRSWWIYADKSFLTLVSSWSLSHFSIFWGHSEQNTPAFCTMLLFL